MARPKKEDGGFSHEDLQNDAEPLAIAKVSKSKPSNMRIYEQWPVKVSYRTELDSNKEKVQVPTISKKGTEPIRKCSIERTHAQTLNCTSLKAQNPHRYYDVETGEVPVMENEDGQPLIWEDYAK